MPDPPELRRLTSGRWHIPLLALLHERRGARFVEMLATLGLSRSVLSRALATVQGAGWVTPNPGHGHPLRPEYILTPQGEIIAAWCARLMEQRRALRLEPQNLPRWSLPMVAGLESGWKRFSTLEADLAPVTARALSLTLKRMISADLVDRRLESEFPPFSLYGLTCRGRELAGAMAG